MEFLFLFIGLLVGGIITGLYLKLSSSKKATEANIQLIDIEKETADLRIKLQVAIESKANLETQLFELKEELNGNRERVIGLNSKLSAKETAFAGLQEKLDNQAKEIEALQQKFSQQFDNLANKIFEEKAQKFTQQNKENIDQVLKPLNEKLKDFEKKVEETYVKNLKDRTDLQAEVKKLYDLNARISQDANNLTKALKGDVKKQGNWGEMVLERILESSGLEKGREYVTQQSFQREEGGRYQPDVIIYLPDNKHIVVDAKVSLVAYENFVAAETPEEQNTFIKEHLKSIRAHIKELAGKQYYKLEGVNTPEYVLMFVPIESSFSVAVREDNALFNEAWENKIVIVSPSTLLATLMTVSSIWKQENQTQNAIEIARQSGNLYDKFEGLLSDLINLGKRLEDTQKYYRSSMNKLTEGSGNLISRVEKLKSLGAKASKSLPQSLIDRAMESHVLNEDETPLL